jgi:hypothetical protein
MTLASEQLGIDIDTLEAPPPPPSAAQAKVLGIRLVQSANALAHAARTNGAHDEDTSQLVDYAGLMAVKAERAAWELSDPPTTGQGGGRAADAVLLLIEWVSGRISGEAHRLASFVKPFLIDRFETARAEFGSLVAPWIAAVSRDLRTELEVPDQSAKGAVALLSHGPHACRHATRSVGIVAMSVSRPSLNVRNLAGRSG